MRTLLTLWLLFVCLTADAQQNYANTNTGAITATTPYQLTLPDGSVQFGPTSNQLAAAGWLTVSNAQVITTGYVATAWSIILLGNGWCNIIITSSNNIQASFNASITNSPLWSLGFINTMKTWRSVLRAYDGVGQETNAVITWSTASNFFATNQPFLAIPTNGFNANWLVDGATPILQLGFADTASFWKWWNLYIGL